MKRLSGINLTIVTTLVAGLVLLASVAGGDVTRLDSIDLAQSPIATTYTITPTGPVQYQEYALENPSRLVLDLVGVKNAVKDEMVKADGTLCTAVHVSQFQSDPDLVTRVVFELGADAHYKVTRRGASIEVAFGGTPPVMGASLFGEAPAADAAAPAPATPATTDVAAAATPSNDWVNDTPSQDSDAAWPQATGDDAAEPAGDEIVLAQNNTRAATEMTTPLFGSTLSNQPMTIDVQGADIKTVLRSISEFSGVNIVAGPDVEGPVVIHLKNVPWKEALDTILRSQGYDWRDNYGIIRVAPSEQLQDDEIKAVTVERKKEEMGSLVTRTVKLDYINATEAKIALNKMTTPRGTIDAEKSTNTLIIAEVPGRADKIVEMVKQMDQKLRQVDIVAKMVDVDHEATRELGVNWAAVNLQFGSQAAGDIVTGQRLTQPFSTVRVGTVQSWGDVNLIIDAMEKDNKANIVSNPHIATADNQEARIMVGKEIPLIVSDEAGNPITELKKIGVILRCTPHVNSDGTITLDLHPELSDLSSQATVQGGVIITLQEADTRVVVRDGETAVIGGLISEDQTSLRTGVPVLKDMPVLGPLFRYESKTKKKRELIIFVTPKVVG